ncbi:TRAP transporter small permease subunit [Parendozoicomonas haliclonae]|uniref:TRAP transporter small permease protein n=1 Tax=Parendozoicomonas haliclonae TaxID=1960125 RepID=A0A1X7AH96_9GAMM|nr:TRAP transporter small permease subunit [Parendozoicomonas haliclonae]SMA35260.1 2,3-diketo-L-gulonate TRAP transporter small permease protein YiaM [Parendozoicomonas haliclonae]
MLVQLEDLLNRFSDLLGKVAAVLFILLIFNVFYDVVARYVFNDVSIGLQELEWHLFAAVFMLGVPYTLRANGHVRVDLIYERLSIKKRALIDLLGALILLLPFALLVGYYGIGFAQEAYELGETSGDPGGLPHRWIIKAVIPFTFFSIAVSGLAMMLHSINVLTGKRSDGNYTPPQH